MYTDLITRLKNAQAVNKATVRAPYNKMDFEILRVLRSYGFIKSYRKIGRLPKRFIEVELSYDGKSGKINGTRLISKPSRNLYFGYRKIFSVRQGYGLGIFSTPKGIMSDREVRKNKVGGVYLFEIW